MTARVVAVAGAKGSPGISFVSAGLALCLAAGGLETLLIDADSEAPSLARTLGGGRAAGPAPLRVASRLALLQPQQLDGHQLVAAARAGSNAVVIDLGHQIGPFQRQVSLAVDWLLWVVGGDALGLERADHLLTAEPLVSGSSGIVFNRWRRSSPAAGRPYLTSRHRLPLMAVIREGTGGPDRSLVARPPHRDRVLARSFGELARSVHPEAKKVARAWP